MRSLIKCLLIDDDTDDQEIFKLCIRRIGDEIDCTVMDDAATAIKVLEETDYTPHYIFLDINMPKINGIECLRQLRKIDRLNQTKIFMYSTSAHGKTFDESNVLGAEGFILKPTKMNDLKDKLISIFN